MNRLLLICLSIFSFTFVNWQISKAEDALCSIRSVTRTKREDTIVVNEKLGSDPDHTWGEAAARATPTESVLTQICNVVELRAGLGGRGGTGGSRSGPRLPPKSSAARTGTNPPLRSTYRLDTGTCINLFTGDVIVPHSFLEQCTAAVGLLTSDRGQISNSAQTVMRPVLRLALREIITGRVRSVIENFLDSAARRMVTRVGTRVIPGAPGRALDLMVNNILSNVGPFIDYGQLAIGVPTQALTGIPSAGGTGRADVVFYTVYRPVGLSSSSGAPDATRSGDRDFRLGSDSGVRDENPRVLGKLSTEIMVGMRFPTTGALGSSGTTLDLTQTLNDFRNRLIAAYVTPGQSIFNVISPEQLLVVVQINLRQELFFLPFTNLSNDRIAIAIGFRKEGDNYVPMVTGTRSMTNPPTIPTP